MTTMQIDRAMVEQALETIEGLTRDRLFTAEWAGKHGATIAALRAALAQKPKFMLSCGCPSQYGGVPAYWDRDRSTAFGMICEKHWHEYGARSEA